MVVLCFILFSPRSEYKFSKKELVQLSIPTSAQAVPFAGGTAYLNAAEGKLFYLNAKGNPLWGFEGAVDGMRLVAGHNSLAAYISTKLQMISKDGALLFSKTYDYPIQKLAMGNDIYVILQMPEGTVSNLLVLNSKGEVIDTLTEQTNQRLLDFGTFGNNGIWVITVDTGGISPEYKFSTYRYDPQKRITVSHNESGQIIYRPVFGENTISLVCSDEIIAIDYTGKEQRRTRVNGYEYLASSSGSKAEDVLLAKLDAAGNRIPDFDELLCVNSQGQAFKLNVNEPVVSAAVTKEYYYIFTKYKILRYDKKKLKVKEYIVPEPVNGVVGENDNHILLFCNKAVYNLALS